MAKRHQWLVLYRLEDGMIDAFVFRSIVAARNYHKYHAKADLDVIMIPADDLLEAHLAKEEACAGPITPTSPPKASG